MYKHMNWQTEEIFKSLEKMIADSGVFTCDQVAYLQEMIRMIAQAVDKESSCLKLR